MCVCECVVSVALVWLDPGQQFVDENAVGPPVRGEVAAWRMVSIVSSIISVISKSQTKVYKYFNNSHE